MRSVLEQSETDLELIIADDGSTDDTESMVKSMNDPRIRYLPLRHSGHIGITRNAGASAARGNWIAFLDSDDSWLPRKLEKQLAALRASGGCWSYCGFQHIDENGSVIPAKAGRYMPRHGWITKGLLTHEIAAIVCTLLVERSLYRESGGFSVDPRLALRGDYEFVLRLSQLAEATAEPGVLVNVLEHKDRITRSVKDPFTRSMMPYIVFLETQQDRGLRELARKQINRLILQQRLAGKRSFQDILSGLSSSILPLPFKAVKLP
jgi:glycosyltransferase involved in cell wall biosynthesis